MSRFCFRHRLLVVAVWVLAIVGGVFAAGPVFSSLDKGTNDAKFESVVGSDVLDAAETEGGSVIAVVDRVDPNAAATKSAVEAAAADVRTEQGVTRVDTPYTAGPALVSTDKRALLVIVHYRKDLASDVEDASVDAVSNRLDKIDDGLSGAKVQIGGDQVLGREINATVQNDLSTAEMISLPLTLVFMVIVFGGFIAAGLPVLGAVASVATAMLTLWGFSKFVGLGSDTVTVVTLLGLGLSIDYGLLVVSRYREELAGLVAAAGPGLTPKKVRVGKPILPASLREEAASRAGATAGRTVAFSALTVMASFLGLVLVQMPFLQAIGAAGISIALVTMLTAVTLIPALLRLVGRRITPAGVKRFRKAKHVNSERGLFAALARGVQRRPVVVLIGALGVLMVAAIPVFSVKISDPGLGEIPTSIESRRVLDTLDGRFGRQEAPAISVVARTDAAALDRWAAGFADDPEIRRIGKAEQVRPGTSVVAIDVKGDANGSDARHLVERLRADRPDGGESWVTGQAAFFHDELTLYQRDLPLAAGVIAVAMFILLFLMTGSVVVPIKALLMNLVSMGATFGAMVAAFQWGWGAGPLDLLVNPGLDPAVLMVIFVFAFGLSMDYETFLLARVKEEYDSGRSNDQAVRAGLQRTGRIITSAAIAMVIVFSCFVLGDIGTVEQIGLGLVVAVLVDATIVRCLLVPATMTLLGRANWWAPKPLRKLHDRFGLREAPSALEVVRAPEEPVLSGASARD
ncbi:MMPL family transporter [Cryptosporangium phraense]|uniref:MMPL family transporter n=1 Tax=Cryptosporangium phraense TaxID=2593070 RepID=UPI0014792DB6|nr:MMPL family transporter [Cryptosporangium phraense]